MSIGLNEKTCDILRKPLAEFKRVGSGGTFSYHKGPDVIRRLNEAFGHSWSSEKVEVEVVEGQVLMLVSINVFVDGDVISHQGYGSADIARRSSDKKAINIGNSYKSAFTTALKKAAEQFGIGLGDEEEEIASSPPARNYTAPSNRPPMSAAPSMPIATSPRSFTPMTSEPSASKAVMSRHIEAMPERPRQSGPHDYQGGGLSAGAAAAKLNATAPVHAPVPVAVPIVDTSPAPMAIPAMNQTDTINPMQEHALQRLASMKGILEEELVRKALPNSGKGKFIELLRSEASEVIKYANVQPQGSA